jgi:hypothetical protein
MKTDISKFDPCIDGAAFYEKYFDFESAWNACECGDWMLWIANKLGADERLMYRAKAMCANTVRHLMRDPRSTADICREILTKEIFKIIKTL